MTIPKTIDQKEKMTGHTLVLIENDKYLDEVISAFKEEKIDGIYRVPEEVSYDKFVEKFNEFMDSFYAEEYEIN